MEGRSRNRLIRMARPRRTGSIVVATRSWAALVQDVALGGVLLVAFPTRCVGFSSVVGGHGSRHLARKPLSGHWYAAGFLRPAAVTLTPVGFLSRPRSSSTPSFHRPVEGLPRLVREVPDLVENLGQVAPLSAGEPGSQAAGVRAWWDANGATLIGEPTRAREGLSRDRIGRRDGRLSRPVPAAERTRVVPWFPRDGARE